MKKFIRYILFGLLALISLAYLTRKQTAQRVLRLSKMRYRVIITRNIAIPTPDGVSLMADHYAPRADGDFPTVFIRTPYGRNHLNSNFGWYLEFIGKRFAERGYHVLIQDVRGRFESGGEFSPYFSERADAAATITWLESQSWFNGVIGMWSGSYLGIVQWAIAPHHPAIRAIVPAITSSDLYPILYPDGAFDLGLAMRWMAVFHQLDKLRGKPLIYSATFWQEVERKTQKAFDHLPIRDDDIAIFDKPVDYYRLWLDNADPTTPTWDEMRQMNNLSALDTPVHLIGGWYDFFLRGTLADYHRLREAGKNPYLTIGGGHHFSTIASMIELTEGLRWFDAHLKGDKSAIRQKPVRLYVMGIRQWRDYDQFPPANTRPTPFYLHQGGELSADAPRHETPDNYMYDPQHPTPYIGGTQFHLWNAGKRDNRRIEQRDDVLVYTTAPLSAPLEVIGYVRLQLYVYTDVPCADFYGRLCDVHPDGRSYNICDGLMRLSKKAVAPQPDGTYCIEVDMWATAHHFKAGHRLRLQIASAAHPRWSRNLCVDAPFLTCTEHQPAHQQIFHDADHPSALILPMVG
ncbi:MAG: X-Pro dipeptidyl-peptidase [Phototrophicales bacterium]|nr:MAG: X-Pro dipeptidyl-peptidase [Phototrophicales bacterium]